MSTAAEASVAWPHNGTSVVGVNQRSRNSRAVANTSGTPVAVVAAVVAVAVAVLAAAAEPSSWGKGRGGDKGGGGPAGSAAAATNQPIARTN